MADPKAKPKPDAAPPAVDAPPKFIRFTRGGVTWQNTVRWPSPPDGEPLPFRVGDIFREDDDTWIVFGLPDPALNDSRIRDAQGQPPSKNRAVTRMGDVTDLVLVAWIPEDPALPIAEAFTTRGAAASMVQDLQVEALKDWLGEDDDEDDPSDAAPALTPGPAAEPS